MAGIGFELRRLLSRNTLGGTLTAYAYAGMIGSGPWVLSIIGILLVGLLASGIVVPPSLVTQFQTTVTYLIASSLILTGGLQLAFTRYVSDRLFEKRDELVLPNLHGVLGVVLGAAAALATLAMAFLFEQVSFGYRLLVVAAFTTLCGVWVLAVLLSGLKRYKAIVLLFAVGYGLVVALAYPLARFGLEGLLAAFVTGQLVLLGGMWVVVAQTYPSHRSVSYHWLHRRTFYPSLLVAGSLYNLAVWADKFLFWVNPVTSEPVVGPLRGSIIYDLPVFLAYLSIVPGMAVFLVRIETDFAEYYERFFNAVREGASLEFIQDMHDEMVYAVRQGLGEIAKIQSIAVLATFVAGPTLLAALGISALYLPLLQVQVVGASLQVMLLAVLNVLFYLDRRRIVVALTMIFLVANTLFTAMTLKLGAPFYGYGFTVALLLTVALGLVFLDRKLDRIEYETFMFQ
jgi:uncharacterized membrane protein